MKILLHALWLTSLLFLNLFPVNGQALDQWNSYWITCPGTNQTSYQVVEFRKKFNLEKIPQEFNIQITADNRYRLYINGQYAGYGPQQSDIRHYRYETLDIASFLKNGENIIAAEVINWGTDRPYGVVSAKTGLLIQGKTKAEEVVNTSEEGWKCFRNPAYSPRPVNWMYAVDIVGGFYASAHGDSLKCDLYPWGWQQADFDDRGWKNAVWTNHAVSDGGSFFWILEPRNTPLLVYEKERFRSILRAEGIKTNQAFLSGEDPLHIPPFSTVSLLIDHEQMSLGYPEMIFSGGNGASITISYAENLFDEKRQKGNRNETAGKNMIGIKDVILPDGGSNRSFKPFYHKAFRFIQLDIETGKEELVIRDYYNEKTTTPIAIKAGFECSRDYSRLTEICTRTLELCTQENFVSDAYYETMQYVGDSRAQAFAWTALTGDKSHFRNALVQFQYSVLPDGNLTSCYPLKSTFVHPTYSLVWIDMVHDYMMHFGEKDLIRNWLPAIEGILDYFERIKNENGIPGKSAWPYFADWYNLENSGGIAPVSKNGNSALVSLHLVYSLKNAAEIFRWMDDSCRAGQYMERAEEYIKIINRLFYDPVSEMYFEDPDKTFADQRPNIMAVLTDALPPEKQKQLLDKVIGNSDLSRAGLYYRYNYFDALAHAGAGEYFDRVLEPWWEVVKAGLTTTPETPVDESPRSEAHPWSTSPVWGYYHVLCGIRPLAPAFSEAVIAPSPGSLEYIRARYPHPAGMIVLDLDFRKSKPRGSIEVPEGAVFRFIWKGESLLLKPGLNRINP